MLLIITIFQFRVRKLRIWPCFIRQNQSTQHKSRIVHVHILSCITAAANLILPDRITMIMSYCIFFFMMKKKHTQLQSYVILQFIRPITITTTAYHRYHVGLPYYLVVSAILPWWGQIQLILLIYCNVSLKNVDLIIHLLVICTYDSIKSICITINSQMCHYSVGLENSYAL